MDVQCPNCGGEYELDDSLVATSGTSVRCIQCSHVFNVYQTATAFTEQDEWFVRKPDTGETFRFEGLGELQQSISSGQVNRDDLFSRGSQGHKTWKRLSDIPEMQPLFEATDVNIKVKTSRPKLIGEAATLPPPPMAKPMRTTPPMGHRLASDQAAFTPSEPGSGSVHDPDFSQVPADIATEDWQQGRAPSIAEPAWTERTGAAPMRAGTQSGFLPPRKRRLGRWIATLALLLLAGGGAYLAVVGPSTLSNFADRFLSNRDDDRFNQFFARGRESFLLDSEVPHYRQADIEYQKALALNEKHAPTMAALAELHSTWAQSLRDTEVDVAADDAATGDSQDSRKVEWLRREYELRLAEAGRWADQATAAGPELLETRRAVANVLRLRGKLDEARAFLARGELGDPETRFVGVMIALDEGNAPATLLSELDGILAESPLLRVFYRKARVLASLGREAEARATLAKLFELNQDHLRGRELLSRIDAKLPVLLAVRQSQQDAARDTEVIAAAPSEPDTQVDQPPAGPGARSQASAQPPSGPPKTKTAPAEAPGKPAAKETRGAQGWDGLLRQAAGMQRSGRCAEAIPLFDLVLERTPTNLDALCGLAACHREQKALGQAITLYRRALGINPVFGPALFGLADAFRAQGQDEQALKYYRQYLSSNPNGREAEAARRAIETLSAKPAATPPGEAAAPPIVNPPTESPEPPPQPTEPSPNAGEETGE